MKKVLITIPEGNLKDTFLPVEVRRYMETYFDVSYNVTTSQFTKEELKELLKGFDAVLTGWGTPMLDKMVLKGNDRLSLIVHTGGTVGNLIDSYAYDKKITVFSGNRLYAESVAEGVLSYMLMGLRRIPDYINMVREGQWRTEEDLWEGLLDRTIGIVGVGTISKILIQMLQIFRVKIKVFSHYPVEKEFLEKYNSEQVGLEEIFSSCDIISVHSALNDENRGLIHKKHFELIKDGALFLNTARGAIIDEKALIEELKKNRFHAVLDVYQEEPIAAHSELRKLKNVYSIPHMAGPTLDRRPIITKSLIDEMRRFYAGGKHFELQISATFAKRMTKM